MAFDRGNNELIVAVARKQDLSRPLLDRLLHSLRSRRRITHRGNPTRMTSQPPPVGPDLDPSSLPRFNVLGVGVNALTAVPPDKGNSAQRAKSNDAVSATDQQATQNAANPLFAAPPPSLQALAAAFPGGNEAAVTGLNIAQVIDQVAHSIQVTYHGGQAMQVHLNPPELGSLQVDVSVNGGVLSARLEAQTPAAQQILVDNLSQLKNSLSQQGVSFDRIDVRLADSNRGAGGSGTANWQAITAV